MNETNIGLTKLIEWSFYIAVICLPIIYTLSKRKSSQPLKNTFKVFFLMLFPLINIIAFVQLYLTSDLLLEEQDGG